ncbi:MAG: IS1/IS1595 family N-terminal zinc-binding domain-containing protein [Methylococcales bacterium]
MSHCPKCSSKQTVKNGYAKGKPRWKCKDCGYQFTRLSPRGKPLEMKLMCVLLYCHGVSLNALAGIYQVATSSVLRWVRTFAKQHYEKPMPAGRTIVMELDEMWHYLEKKHGNSGSGRLWIVIPENSSIGSVVIGLAQH